MTDRQKAFIESLAAERAEMLAAMALGGGTPQEQERAKFVVRVLRGESGTVPTAAASNAIDWLLRDVRRDAPAAAAPAVDVPAGRYALVNTDGIVKFYAVDRPTEGRWAGYVFVNALGSEERYPIRDRAEKARILAEIGADVDDARVRYGVELGRCGNCGRALTDETSRQAGIGPDCADRLGIDRSVYAERAAKIAAARARGDYREDGEDDGHVHYHTDREEVYA
jgi:hypothetical protein